MLAKDQGWHVDSTFDLARVFRLPGTYNRKREPIPVLCHAWEPHRRYSPTDFDTMLPPLTTCCLLPHPQQMITTFRPYSRCRFSVRLKYLLRVGDNPITQERYPSRSEATFAVMSALVAAGYTDRHIVAVMMNPCYVLSERPRQKGETWLLQEIARARTKGRPRSPSVLVQGRQPSAVRFTGGAA